MLVGAAVTTALSAAPASARAEAIVVNDIEYLNSEGRPDDEARTAVQTYLQFFLSRLSYGKPQTVGEYMRDCRLGKRGKEADGACAIPDFAIQLQMIERNGEVQISGAVNQATDARNSVPHAIDPVRVKLRDLTTGLSYVAKDINLHLARVAARAQQAHIVIACFASASDAPVKGSRTKKRHGVTPPISTTAVYAARLPRALEAFMRDQPGITASIVDGSAGECGSVAGLQAIAQKAKADAVLSGRVFPDDRSGLMVLPYMYLAGSSKKVALALITVDRGAETASFLPDGQRASKTDRPADHPAHGGIDSLWYFQVAQKLGAAANALVSPSERGEFLKAIESGNELSYYLRRAKERLASAPPDHEAGEALLELAIAKAPGDAEAYLMLAAALTDRRRYGEAAAKLRSGIEQVSDRRTLYVALADNFVRAGELTAARRVYEQALAATALAEEEAWLGIAKTYFSDRTPDRSVKLAKEYALKAAMSNRSSDAYLLAGQIAEGENNFDEAEKFYKKARELSPRSTEIASRLGRLYERKASDEARKNNHREAIALLTKAIEVSPSVKRHYDRASEHLRLGRDSGDRSTGYGLASADLQAALDIAYRDGAVLAQFPWLMPTLAETLIFEGDFKQAKNVIQSLFLALARDTSIRPATNPRDIRLIAAFLNAAAEMLDSGVADKEFYLLENASLGIQRPRLSWSFGEMQFYLDKDYPHLTSELHSGEREMRVATVKQWIGRLSNQSP